MLSYQAKTAASELLLLQESSTKNLLVAAFIESCCPGDTNLEKRKSAIDELNQRFKKKYPYTKLTEWINEIDRGGGYVTRCPEQVERHMQARLIMSLSPAENDFATVALLRILNIPYKAAEMALRHGF